MIVSGRNHYGKIPHRLCSIFAMTSYYNCGYGCVCGPSVSADSYSHQTDMVANSARDQLAGQGKWNLE